MGICEAAFEKGFVSICSKDRSGNLDSWWLGVNDLNVKAVVYRKVLGKSILPLWVTKMTSGSSQTFITNSSISSITSRCLCYLLVLSWWSSQAVHLCCWAVLWKVSPGLKPTFPSPQLHMLLDHVSDHSLLFIVDTQLCHMRYIKSSFSAASLLDCRFHSHLPIYWYVPKNLMAHTILAWPEL